MVAITAFVYIAQFIMNFMSNFFKAINDGDYKFVYCDASSVVNGTVFAVVILTNNTLIPEFNHLNITSSPSYSSLVPGRKPASASAKASSKA